MPGPFLAFCNMTSVALMTTVIMSSFEIFRASPRNHAVNAVLSDFDDDVSHDVAQLDAGNFSFQLVTGG